MKTLIKTLIDKKVVKEGTVIGAKLKLSSDMSAIVEREMMFVEMQGEYMICQDEQRVQHKVRPGSVNHIDGMEPTRFAFCHSINPDGSPYVSKLKKRGRPSRKDIAARNTMKETQTQ